jgi:hypothetical protein
VRSGTGTIIAWAAPRDQERIQRTLDEMRVENSPENKARLELYPFEAENVGRVIRFILGLAPAAKVTMDPEMQNLVVWATNKDHKVLRESLAKFSGGGTTGGPIETARQLGVYSLTKADPTSTLTLLKTLVPRARLAFDPQTRRLIVLATVADLNTVRGTLEELQPAKPGPSDPELRFYAIKTPSPGTMLTGLQALAPTARITLDAVEHFETAPASRPLDRIAGIGNRWCPVEFGARSDRREPRA